ncbi:MAG: Asp23/Gls24 family envelope stress response protein [Allobranchiibius sp.]
MAEVTEAAGGKRSDPAARGVLDIRTAAIEHLVEIIADEVPGTVRFANTLDKLRSRGYPNAQASVRGSTTWISLDIAVQWPSPVESIAAHVRSQVLTEATRLSGSEVRRVDVTVHVLSADQVGPPRRRVQ